MGWNGLSNAGQVPSVNPDASGSWGCGAFWGTRWFQWQWEGQSREWVIAPKELLPILLALVVWGRRWVGCRVECYCDNVAVVAVINSGRAKDRILMHLLGRMFFVAAHLDIHIHASHVPGIEMLQRMHCPETVSLLLCKRCQEQSLTQHPSHKH